MGTAFKDRDWTFPMRCKSCGKRPNWWGMRFGVETHRIQFEGTPYMDRYAICLGLIEIRLHKIWRGDDDRAPHDHPWWFITFPFANYLELVPTPGAKGYFEEDRDWWAYSTNVVRRFRFHFRPPGYKHILVRRADELDARMAERHITNHKMMKSVGIVDKPFWTFVITGRKTSEWGFWKTPSTYVHNRDWIP